MNSSLLCQTGHFKLKNKMLDMPYLEAFICFGCQLLSSMQSLDVRNYLGYVSLCKRQINHKYISKKKRQLKEY